MSQVEQDFTRNFCPNCTVKVPDSAISCNLCGNTDLIPDPYPEQLKEELKDGYLYNGESKSSIWDKDYFQKMGEKLDEEILAVIEEAASKKEESKLQLDQVAVDALLTRDFGLLTGLAGSGKSTLINEMSRLNPNLLEIAATTGIAAVNLNSKTINSILKYFDTKSLENAWREQLLHMNLRKVRAKKKKLLIDEASMMDAEQLNYIINAVDEINSDGTGKTLGVWLTADFLQLPPIKAKYVFHSDYWDRFEKNTIKLTKIWRQSDPEFLSGLNFARAGKGKEAITALKKAGVKITDKLDEHFEGSTIIPLNANVDSFNEKRLREITNPLIRVTPKKRGRGLPEWDRLIPIELRLKVGALVMILANDIPNFNYVNGDLATVESYDPLNEVFFVKLKRNNDLVSIKRIRRENFSDTEPEKHYFTPTFTPYVDYKSEDWVIGTIDYFPLRLAWATTVHKSQGLSLDLVQIDTSPKFFGESGMAYVALSRARTPDGLVLVGKEENIIRKINTNLEVRRFI